VDPDTLVLFTFDESALPLANHGYGSAISVSNHAGTTPTLGGGAMTFNGANQVYSPDTPYAGPSTTTQTMMMWVYPTALGGDQCCVGKTYRPYNNPWAAPYHSFYVGPTDSAGNWTVFLSLNAGGGAFQQIFITTAGYRVVQNAWNLIGFTLNAGTLKPYFNGVTVPGMSTSVPNQAIDTTGGGPYEIGAVSPAGTPTSFLTGKIGMFRWDQIVRSDPYLLAMYNAGP
jgi:hypothetical protein